MLHYYRFFYSSFGVSVLDSHYHFIFFYVFYFFAQPFELRSFNYCLKLYHYMLHFYTLRFYEIHFYILYRCALYFFARFFAFNVHIFAFAFHIFKFFFGSQSYRFFSLTSFFDLLFVFYPVVFRALVSNYFHFEILKHLIEYHLSELRPLNNSAFVFQIYFNQYLSFHIRILKEIMIQYLLIFFGLVFINRLYFVYFISELFLTRVTHFLISLISRFFALFFVSIYFFLTFYNVSLVCAVR